MENRQHTAKSISCPEVALPSYCRLPRHEQSSTMFDPGPQYSSALPCFTLLSGRPSKSSLTWNGNKHLFLRHQKLCPRGDFGVFGVGSLPLDSAFLRSQTANSQTALQLQYDPPAATRPLRRRPRHPPDRKSRKRYSLRRIFRVLLAIGYL